jgi:hypothetical protein
LCASRSRPIQALRRVANGLEQARVRSPAGEVAHDDALESVVAVPRAQRPIDEGGALTRLAEPRVDSARVVIGPRVGLHATADPLGGAAQPVEVHVAADGLDLARPGHALGRDQLGAGAVLGLGAQHEARIVRVGACIS